MLSDNIRINRKNRGFSQEELAIRLHVTRQTVSKWERGISVPDAALLQDMASILEVPVAELLDANAADLKERDDLVEQLSRINEQLAIKNRRSGRIIKAVVIIGVIVTALIMAHFLHSQSKYATSDHIGKLEYSMPRSGFVHEKDDIGVSVEKDGRYRIDAKIYRDYGDMTEISIWEYDRSDFDNGDIEAFKKEHEGKLVEYSGEYGTLPEVVEDYYAATDATDDYIGRYYEAHVVIRDKIYIVEVQNGDDVRANGEGLISSMRINDSLEYDYK